MGGGIIDHHPLPWAFAFKRRVGNIIPGDCSTIKDGFLEVITSNDDITSWICHAELLFFHMSSENNINRYKTIPKQSSMLKGIVQSK